MQTKIKKNVIELKDVVQSKNVGVILEYKSNDRVRKRRGKTIELYQESCACVKKRHRK